MTLIPGPTAEEQVAFLGKVERLLSEGQFVATYKYALLVAIADLAIKHGSDDGSEPDLPVSAIAETHKRNALDRKHPRGELARNWVDVCFMLRPQAAIQFGRSFPGRPPS